MGDVAINPLIVKTSPVLVEYLTEVVDFSDLEIDAETFGIISTSAYRKVKISWPETIGAASYNVYGSPNILNRTNKLNTSPILTTSFTFEVPVFPNTIKLYFWVARQNAIGDIEYLSVEPATEETNVLIDQNIIKNPLTPFAGIPATDYLNTHMQFIVEEMRRRHRFMLENDGEDVQIFVRRFTGAPCDCNKIGKDAVPGVSERALFSDVFANREDDFGQKQDPDYQGRGRCLLCFGTGILGGYYPGFGIKIRYGGLPIENINRNKFGWQVVHNFGSWTLWSPKLTQHDIVVRKDGNRFAVAKSSISEFRKFPLHQEMDFDAIPQTDIRQQITSDLINLATRENDFLPIGIRIFG